MTRWLIVPAATVFLWTLLFLALFLTGCSPGGHIYFGSLSLPLSLYEGTSQSVHVAFEQDMTRSRLHKALMTSTLGESTRLELLVPGDSQAVSLQVELQAPDVMFGGDAKQTQSLSAPRLQYDWTLNFNSAGRKVLSFVFGLSDKQGKVTTVGHVDREVEVIRLGFMSKSQAAVLATLAAVLGLLSLLTSLIKPIAQRLLGRPKATGVASSAAENAS